jgi:tetratricopeptide (TPR) repeat protein
MGRILRSIALSLGVCGLTASAPSLAQSASRAEAIALEQQGKIAEAEHAWQQIAAANPRDGEAFAHLGLLASRQEHYQEAIDDYHKAIALSPGIPNLKLNLGLALFKTSRYPEAVKAFTDELQEHAADQRLLILMGMSHYGMGDYLVAIPYLQKASEADPSNLPLRLAWAHSCMWSKQYECVLNVYREILALNADSAEADMLAGEALDEKGDDTGAIEQFRSAVKAKPNEPNAHFGLGYLLWKQHHYRDAADEFKAELAIDSAQQQAQAYLGDALVELHEFAEAQPALEAASQGNALASASMVHRDLGIVYQEAGRNDDAVAELREAIALDAKDVSPHWRLGKLYQSMGRQEEAKAELGIARAMKEESAHSLTQQLLLSPAAPLNSNQ